MWGRQFAPNTYTPTRSEMPPAARVAVARPPRHDRDPVIRHRNWCFTVNNYSDAYVDRLKGLASNSACKYLGFAKEVGASGTPHLQGLVVFVNAKTMQATKNWMECQTVHLEVTRGTCMEAADYFRNPKPETGKLPPAPEDLFEHGELPLTNQAIGQAEKERWKVNLAHAKAGNLDEIDPDIYFRYYNTCKQIKKDHMAKPDDLTAPCGIWYWGEPGVGKSHRARQEQPDAYFKMQNKWWDGYQDQPAIILDDFDSKELGHHLKIWADQYAFVAETKGHALFIRPKVFIITSNYQPKDLWTDSVLLSAIERRFNIVKVLPRVDSSSGEDLV